MLNNIEVYITQETGLLAVGFSNTDMLELTREDVVRLKQELDKVDLSKVAPASEYDSK